MKNHAMGALLRIGVTAAALVLFAADRSGASSQQAVFTTVSASASGEYVRGKNADGTFQAETYAFGKGGLWASTMRDDTIDKLDFTAIARTLAVPLAGQGYIPSRDPNDTKLLIMVYWGATSGAKDTPDSEAYRGLQADQTPPEVVLPTSQNPLPASARSGIQGTPNRYDPGLILMVSLQNKLRDAADFQNAGILGYDTALPLIGMQQTHTAFSNYRDDLITELEYSRYFVVLMAYDFQATWKQRKYKLLWETRFSIAQHNNDFGKQLRGMALYASKYFGADSHGLIRKPLPEGNVEVGVPTTISAEP
jgi:hypothetical protein